MNEVTPEETKSQPINSLLQNNALVMTVVIAVMIIILYCIGACSSIMIAFLFNAPWK